MEYLENLHVTGSDAARLMRKDMRAHLYQVHRLMKRHSMWCGHLDAEGTLEDEQASLMLLRRNLIQTWRVLERLPDEVADIELGDDTIYGLIGRLIDEVEDLLNVLGIKCPAWDSWCKPQQKQSERSFSH